MKTLYEAWQYDDGGVIVLAEAEGIRQEMTQGLIANDAKLLHQIEAEYWEEAQTLHYLKMGWRKYKPEGEAKECPNECGALFYPKGSGECRNCGKIVNHFMSHKGSIDYGVIQDFINLEITFINSAGILTK